MYLVFPEVIEVASKKGQKAAAAAAARAVDISRLDIVLMSCVKNSTVLMS